MTLLNFNGACTLWPDGLLWWNWEKCCEAHDWAYAAHLDKALADAALAHCVNSVLPGMGWIMWLGVTVFGGLFYWRARRRIRPDLKSIPTGRRPLDAPAVSRSALMNSNFDASITLVLKSEGGFVDNPADPGGATNMGITRRTLADWRGVSPWWKLAVPAVQALGVDEAKLIYKARYWDVIRGDDLPKGLDYAVFDFAVNSGPQKAVEVLQKIIGVKVDGIVGPLTIAATQKSVATNILELCTERLDFLQSLPTWATFGAGWRNRVESARAAAMAMYSATPVPAPAPTRAPLPAPIRDNWFVALIRAIAGAISSLLKRKV